MQSALIYMDSSGREWIFLGTRDRNNQIEVKLSRPRRKYVKYVEYNTFVKNYTKVGTYGP